MKHRAIPIPRLLISLLILLALFFGRGTAASRGSEPGGILKPCAPMRAPRAVHTATLLSDGNVLVAGGLEGRHQEAGRWIGDVTGAAELYDPAANAFLPAGELSVARHKHAGALLPDGRVLIAGGSDERDWTGQLDSAELFDPANRSFRRAAKMTAPRFKHGAAVVALSDGGILLAGGSSSAETYDSATGIFRAVPGGFGGPRYFSTATRLRDGSVLIAGGYGSGRAGTGPLSTAEAWVFRAAARHQISFRM